MLLLYADGTHEYGAGQGWEGELLIQFVDDRGTDQLITRLDELSYQHTFGEVLQTEWSRSWRPHRMVAIA